MSDWLSTAATAVGIDPNAVAGVVVRPLGDEHPHWGHKRSDDVFLAGSYNGGTMAKKSIWRRKKSGGGGRPTPPDFSSLEEK